MISYVEWLIVGLVFVPACYSIVYAAAYVRARYLRARQRRQLRNQIKPMR